MYARIQLLSTPVAAEPEVLATFQGSAQDAQALHQVIAAMDAEGKYLVQAEKRVPQSPTYEPLDLG